MKNCIWIYLGGLILFSSCTKEDSQDNSTDLEAPQITASGGTGTIQPTYFYDTDSGNSVIPIAFSIKDNSSIQEIKIDSHSGFDGHTHGKSAAKDGPQFKLFSHNQVMKIDEFPDPSNITYTSEIYVDNRNPEIAEDELILAGPYHFSIQATDEEGNQTAYADNSTYHTTVYIRKPYAPQVELKALNVAEGMISGRIYKNQEHSAASDITFLWIYIEQPNTTNPGQEGQVLKEKVWGSSNWPHQFRANQGKTLPDTQELPLDALLDNDTSFFESLKGNRLVIWAEDINGNISIHQFNN